MIRQTHRRFFVPCDADSSDPSARELRRDLESLRDDLIELAFTLERRGQFEAADVALGAAARLKEISGLPRDSAGEVSLGDNRAPGPAK